VTGTGSNERRERRTPARAVQRSALLAQLATAGVVVALALVIVLG